jgi:hypothetical protein
MGTTQNLEGRRVYVSMGFVKCNVLMEGIDVSNGLLLVPQNLLRKTALAHEVPQANALASAFLPASMFGDFLSWNAV